MLALLQHHVSPPLDALCVVAAKLEAEIDVWKAAAAAKAGGGGGQGFESPAGVGGAAFEPSSSDTVDLDPSLTGQLDFNASSPTPTAKPSRRGRRRVAKQVKVGRGRQLSVRWL